MKINIWLLALGILQLFMGNLFSAYLFKVNSPADFIFLNLVICFLDIFAMACFLYAKEE